MTRRCVRTPVACALTLAATAPTACSGDPRTAGDRSSNSATSTSAATGDGARLATVEEIAREVIAAIDALDADGG